MYPSLYWDFYSEEKDVYLTFDDGPIPESTPWVLDLLKKYNLKASFFCIGENVVKHPDIYARLIEEGHRVGNHTQTHVSGWATDDDIYLNEIKTAGQYISTNIFRPPYGRISRSQSERVNKNFKIIMWDVLSGDFDTKLSAEDCYNNIVSNVSSGSILVFHDSLKAKPRLHGSLERVIEFLNREGYTFKTIA